MKSNMIHSAPELVTNGRVCVHRDARVHTHTQQSLNERTQGVQRSMVYDADDDAYLITQIARNHTQK